MVLSVVTVLSGVLLGLAVMLAAAAPLPAPNAAPRTPTATLTPAAPTPTVQPTARAAPLLPSCAARLPAGVWADSARVVDGATLEVVIEGAPLRVGYSGLRAASEPALSVQAAQSAAALLEAQPVYLVRGVEEIDPAGRSLRYVFAGDRFLNLELIQAGLAKADVYTAEKACLNLLQQGEQQPRVDHLGVWRATLAPTATFVPMVTLDPTLSPACDCAKRPLCSDFTRRADAQVCYNACYDYNSRLDSDRDGLACEEIPE